MTDNKMPTDAPGWSAFLLGKPLPTPFRIGQLTLKQMAKEKMAYATIADQLNHDPVLSFLLMEAAGKQALEESSHEIEYSKTLDHAISMIGTDAVNSIVKKAPFQKPSADQVQSIYYVQTLSRGLYAAELARFIAKEKGQFNPNDLYWSALFSYVPYWYLWYFATPEMRLTRYAVNTSRLARTQAQTEVFGCSIEEIAEKIVGDLALPPITKAAYHSANRLTPKEWVELSRYNKSNGQLFNQIDDRDFKLRLQQPNFIVQLSKLIADSAMTDWYSRATKRTLRILAIFLDLTNSEATRISHELAVDASRSHPIPGILLPAARLFLPPIEFKPNQSKKEEENHAEEETTAESNETDTTQESHESDIAAEHEDDLVSIESSEEVVDPDEGIPRPIYGQLVDVMLQKSEDFADVHELMNSATSALIFGLGLGRATVSLIDKQRTGLKTYYATGCDPEESLATYQTKLIKGSLFAKLCSKQASLWVNESTDPKVLSFIPSNFKQACGIDNYFLMSVFVNDRPFAVIYADAPTDSQLTEKKYKYFKYLCKAVSKALESVTAKKS